MGYINVAAEILLDDEYQVFLEDLRKLKSEPEKYLSEKLDEKYEYHPEEIEDSGDFVDHHFFERFSEKKEFTTMIDWSGEDDSNHLRDFVASRMSKLGGYELDFGFVEDWESSLDFDSLERGDYIIEKFNIFAEKLKSIDLSLIFYNNGGDCYYPFVCAVHKGDKVVSLARDGSGCFFERFDQKPVKTSFIGRLLSMFR